MKKRGMKKRVMAALMTACMVVGSVPGVSLADVSGEPSGTLMEQRQQKQTRILSLTRQLHITEHLLRTVRQNLQRPLRLERNSRLRIFLHPRVRAAVTAIRPGINSRLDIL